MSMALKEEELELIGEYVQSHLSEWLTAQPHTFTGSIYLVELGERIVRVEEELKNQRELMKQGFDQIDKRIELLQINMDKRFEQVDKRFEQVDKRFEQVDKRFEQVDKRFEQVDKHFDKVNARIENISTKMFHFMIWSFGFTVTIAGIVIGVIKFM
ncbi:hypothetical protein ES705_41668 [subsurface metagenome]